MLCGRSRAICFDFPPKKGSGISRLIPNCPAPALSLLYQMLAYDPDERISAQTALQHTYFREIRWMGLITVDPLIIGPNADFTISFILQVKLWMLHGHQFGGKK